jgi:hypothetical protein
MSRPLPENRCSTLFTTGHKTLKEDTRLLLWSFCFGLLPWRLLLLAFGLLGFWLLDGGRLFDVGGFGKEKDC